MGQTTYSQTATTANSVQKPATAAATAAANTTYSNYDAALYSAATMYVAQQTNKTGGGNQGGNWNNFKKHSMNKQRMKPQPKPQTLHYCEVCKISCAGPQTYREHLEGQKHKKREASLKLTAVPAAVQQNARGNSLHCELCDVTCTGNDAYAAHVRGAKHQKVFKLHQKLGKPIPSTDPASAAKKAISFVKADGDGAATTETKDAETTADNADNSLNPEDDIKPVGVEYIEEMKDDEGKILSFNCKLCECKFNDPNAKEMHMKGRRHRLQFKKKVQPDLVVDFKPNPRHRRFAEAKAQRAAMQEEYWNRRRNTDGEGDDDDRMMWDRRMEDDYMNWRAIEMRGGNRGRNGPPIGHPFFNMMTGRRPESSDDRHVVHRHAEIYPKEEELQTIQRIVSHTERALKFVSDALTDVKLENGGKSNEKKDVNKESGKDATPENKAKEDGRDNQLFSFQKDTEGGSYRILKGVMRVGLLAKGMFNI